MIKKITHIIISLLIASGILILSGFAIQQNSRKPVSSLEVVVDHGCGTHFVEAAEVRTLVKRFLDTEKQLPLEMGKLREIEKILAADPHVDRAHVYRNIDGAVHVKLSQRQALVRVINYQNESYYIDIKGRLMPVSNKYTPRVLVATGHIYAPYSPVVALNEPYREKSNIKNEKILRELYQLAEFISTQPFWNAYISQVHVTASGEFELIPKNAYPVVEFGKADRLEEKFEKLMVFYQNGLTRVGWNQYRRINIKFSNQVICSK